MTSSRLRHRLRTFTQDLFERGDLRLGYADRYTKTR